MNSLEVLNCSHFPALLFKCTMFSFQKMLLTFHISNAQNVKMHSFEKFGRITSSLKSHFSHLPKTCCNTYTSIFEVLLHVTIVS